MPRPARSVEELAAFKIDDTFFLNFAARASAPLLVILARRESGDQHERSARVG